jgi:type IV pilus assembly protein PilV
MDAEMTVIDSSPRRAHRGFTLIEVLVALLIFSFGVLGIVGLQARAVQFSVQSGDRARAAMLANEIVAQMWAQTTTSPSSDVIAAWQARVADASVAGLPGGAGTVTTATDSASITTATVTITWHPPSMATSSADNQFVTKVVMP